VSDERRRLASSLTSHERVAGRPWRRQPAGHTAPGLEIEQATVVVAERGVPESAAVTVAIAYRR